ncbi:protein serine/threonine phosphatase, partial [Candidatus Thiomargarita nelsonii]
MFETKLATEAAFSENQDRAAIIEHSNGLLLVIADGVGGMAGGREAAELAIQLVKVSAVASEHFMNPFAYSNFLIEADNMLFAHPLAGETTAIVVAVSDDLVCGASVGDSGAFLIQDQS